MSIRVDRGVLAAIRRHPSGIVLLVNAEGSVEAARTAVAAARPDVLRVAKYVSGVLPTPAGAAIFIDGGHSDPKSLRRLPQMVAEHLEAAGVVDGVVTVPKPSSRPSLDGVPRAAVLWAFGRRPARLSRTPPVPEPWMDLAELWMRTPRSSPGRTVALFYGAEFELGDAGIAEFLRACRQGGVDACKIVHEELGGAVTGVNAQLRGGALALGRADATAGDDDLLATFAELRKLARRFAPEAVHAYVDLASPLVRMMSVYAATEWSRSGGELPESISGLCDELSFRCVPRADTWARAPRPAGRSSRRDPAGRRRGESRGAVRAISVVARRVRR